MVIIMTIMLLLCTDLKKKKKKLNRYLLIKKRDRKKWLTQWVTLSQNRASSFVYQLSKYMVQILSLVACYAALFIFCMTFKFSIYC